VLSDYGAVELCENSSPSYDALTDLRLQEWIQAAEISSKDGWVGAEQELVEPNNARRGTIGVVALDRGNLAAGIINWWQGLSGLGVSDPLCQLGITPQPMQLSAVLGLGRHH